MLHLHRPSTAYLKSEADFYTRSPALRMATGWGFGDRIGGYGNFAWQGSSAVETDRNHLQINAMSTSNDHRASKIHTTLNWYLAFYIILHSFKRQSTQGRLTFRATHVVIS